MMKPNLNEPQSRSIKNVLVEMEHLVAVSRALREKASRTEEAGVLVHTQANLSERQLIELKKFEDKTQEQLIMLRDTFELEPVEEDLKHQLLSSFSILWADLEDAKPHRMVGYGEFEPAAAAVLETAMEELAGLCRDFVAVLEKEES